MTTRAHDIVQAFDVPMQGMALGLGSVLIARQQARNAARREPTRSARSPGAWPTTASWPSTPSTRPSAMPGPRTTGAGPPSAAGPRRKARTGLIRAPRVL